MDALVEGAKELGIELAPSQLAAFHVYYRLLVQHNRFVNLTRIVECRDVQLLHFLDSLTCMLPLREELAQRSYQPEVADVGSGGGFPGVPVRIYVPSIPLVLVESVAKKAAFLEQLVAALGLECVAVKCARSEDLGRSAAYRERFPVVMSRAVAPLASLVEMTLPLVAVGGLLIAPKKGDLKRELEEARAAILALGGEVERVRPVAASGLPGPRYLVEIRKTLPTPEQFPRRTGLARKRPLLKLKGRAAGSNPSV